MYLVYFVQSLLQAVVLRLFGGVATFKLWQRDSLKTHYHLVGDNFTVKPSYRLDLISINNFDEEKVPGKFHVKVISFKAAISDNELTFIIVPLWAKWFFKTEGDAKYYIPNDNWRHKPQLGLGQSNFPVFARQQQSPDLSTQPQRDWRASVESRPYPPPRSALVTRKVTDWRAPEREERKAEPTLRSMSRSERVRLASKPPASRFDPHATRKRLLDEAAKLPSSAKKPTPEQLSWREVADTKFASNAKHVNISRMEWDIWRKAYLYGQGW